MDGRSNDSDTGSPVLAPCPEGLLAPGRRCVATNESKPELFFSMPDMCLNEGKRYADALAESVVDACLASDASEGKLAFVMRMGRVGYGVISSYVQR